MPVPVETPNRRTPHPDSGPVAELVLVVDVVMKAVVVVAPLTLVTVFGVVPERVVAAVGDVIVDEFRFAVVEVGELVSPAAVEVVEAEVTVVMAGLVCVVALVEDRVVLVVEGIVVVNDASITQSMSDARSVMPVPV